LILCIDEWSTNWKQQKKEGLLVETLYGPQHFYVAAGSSDEIDNNASTGVVGGNGRCHAMYRNGEYEMVDYESSDEPMGIFFDS